MIDFDRPVYLLDAIFPPKDFEITAGTIVFWQTEVKNANISFTNGVRVGPAYSRYLFHWRIERHSHARNDFI